MKHKIIKCCRCSNEADYWICHRGKWRDYCSVHYDAQLKKESTLMYEGKARNQKPWSLFHKLLFCAATGSFIGYVVVRALS